MSGLVRAVWLGAAVLGFGALVALAIPALRHVEIAVRAGSQGADVPEGRRGSALAPERGRVRSW